MTKTRTAAVAWGAPPTALVRPPWLFHVVRIAAVVAGALASLGAAPVPAPNPALADADPAATANSPSTSSDQDWQLVTRLTAVASYDDNIFIQPHDAQSDYVLHLAPTFAYGLGSFRSEIAPYAPIPHFLARTGEEDLPRKEFAFVSYTPAGVLFDRHDNQDTLNHDLLFAARRERELWSTEGELHFQHLTDASLDAGGRLRQTYYTAAARADAALTGKIEGRLGFFGVHSDYSGGLSSTDVHGTAGLEYSVAPKTSVGFDVVAGYLAVSHGTDQTYQQPRLEVRYVPTEKISFTGQAGEEFRQFGGHIGDRARFVFSMSGDYAAADGTTLSLSSRRETQSSAEFAAENILATYFQGSIRQRFFQRLYASAAGGYVHNAYEGNQPVATISRRDDYYFGRLGLARDLTRRGTIELSYEYRENDSTLGGFGFTENVASAAWSYLF